MDGLKAVLWIAYSNQNRMLHSSCSVFLFIHLFTFHFLSSFSSFLSFSLFLYYSLSLVYFFLSFLFFSLSLSLPLHSFILTFNLSFSMYLLCSPLLFFMDTYLLGWIYWFMQSVFFCSKKFDFCIQNSGQPVDILSVALLLNQAIWSGCCDWVTGKKFSILIKTSYFFVDNKNILSYLKPNSTFQDLYFIEDQGGVGRSWEGWMEQFTSQSKIIVANIY